MNIESKKAEVVEYLRKSIADLTENLESVFLVDLHHPIAELGIDSVKTIQLIILIEKNYNIVFEDEELIIESLSTLQQLTMSILVKLEEKNVQ